MNNNVTNQKFTLKPIKNHHEMTLKPLGKIVICDNIGILSQMAFLGIISQKNIISCPFSCTNI